MAEWNVEPLTKRHERANFSCGESSLDDFVRYRVNQYAKRKLGQTYVAVRGGGSAVLGYYTLAAGSVAFDDLPADSARKLPRHPIPVVLLARLAVDRSCQSQRVGEMLLLSALGRCAALSEAVGVHAVEVVALNGAAASFYIKYGFTPLIDNPLRLYLPIEVVGELLGSRS